MMTHQNANHDARMSRRNFLRVVGDLAVAVRQVSVRVVAYSGATAKQEPCSPTLIHGTQYVRMGLLEGYL